MARELNLHGDDVSHWCDSCGVALEDDDREWCDECENDGEDDVERYEAERLSAKQQHRRDRVRAAHCRDEALQDAAREAHQVHREQPDPDPFESAAELTRNYAALLRRTG
jgi:hypothetical protein